MEEQIKQEVQAFAITHERRKEMKALNTNLSYGQVRRHFPLPLWHVAGSETVCCMLREMRRGCPSIDIVCLLRAIYYQGGTWSEGQAMHSKP